MHTVLRSGGGLITLIFGTLMGKTYSRIKWLAVVMMTLGVAITALDNIKALVSQYDISTGRTLGLLIDSLLG